MSLRVSGNLRLVRLEEGGWRPIEPWWVEFDQLKGINVALPDESAVQWCGRLTINETFRFDGGSFIARDTKNGLEGFAAHDARYRMSRRGLFGMTISQWEPERRISDRLMYLLHRDSGMSYIRAQYLWLGVRICAQGSAKPQPEIERQIVVAS